MNRGKRVTRSNDKIRLVRIFKVQKLRVFSHFERKNKEVFSYVTKQIFKICKNQTLPDKKIKKSTMFENI